MSTRTYYRLPPSIEEGDFKQLLEKLGLSLRKVERIGEHLGISPECVLLRELDELAEKEDE